jgi:tetrahydromethanopterin S-methyltransferase subunit G
MSEAEAGSNNQSDPMESFRELRDAYLDIWSKSMVEAVNTEGYAQASGVMLDSYLTFTAPYRETFEKSTLQTLQQLRLPTSADFAGLAGRLTNIEMRLDDMESKLDRLEKLFVLSEQFSEVSAKLDRMEKLFVLSEQFSEVSEKLDRMEKLFVPMEQFNEVSAKLDRIEQRIMRPQPVQHVERIEPTEPTIQSDPVHQTAQSATSALKQGIASKSVLQAAPVRQPAGNELAQKATAGNPKRLDVRKGAK